MQLRGTMWVSFIEIRKMVQWPSTAMHPVSDHAEHHETNFDRALAYTMPAIDYLYDRIISLTVCGITKLQRAFTQDDFDTHDVHLHTKDDIHEPHDHIPTEPTAESVPEQTFRSVHDVFVEKGEKHGVQTVAQRDGSTMYISGISVPMYKNPTVEFDTQIGIIPYGEAVTTHEQRGRFAHVSWNGKEGWILRDAVVDRVSRIYPEFIVGTENSVDHPNTAHVRAIIGDTFGLSHSEFPLQAGEYILYKLWRRNIRIAWPHIRPRVPGAWHTILRGIPGIQMQVMPKVGSIMEYMINSEIGHVAYVEAVFPDNTIAISEANYPDSGIYNERELTKNEWRELRPVFITVH